MHRSIRRTTCDSTGTPTWNPAAPSPQPSPLRTGKWQSGASAIVFLEEHAPHDRAGRHGRVRAERDAAGEAVALVEADGGVAVIARLEHEPGDPAGAGLGFEPL